MGASKRRRGRKKKKGEMIWQRCAVCSKAFRRDALSPRTNCQRCFREKVVGKLVA